MSALDAHVEDYLRLRLRRALGFKLERHGLLLPQLVAYLEAARGDHRHQRAGHRLGAAARGRPTESLGGPARRREGFRPLPANDRPGDRGAAARRVPRPPAPPHPYLWSQEEIFRLLEGARALRSPLRAATHEALTHYAARRDRLCPRPRFTAFFLSGTGTRLERSGVEKTLRKITTAIGIRTATVRPRAHDLRHSLAVATLIGWLRSGVNVDEHMAELSTYLGHVSPADTYWYLSAAPELMALAAKRLHVRFGAGR